MKMKSITGQAVYVTSDCGFHCTWIQPEWTEVHKRFIRMAMSNGCVPMGVDQSNFVLDEDLEDSEKKKETIQIIMKALRAMKKSPELGDYAASTGMPNLVRLSKRTGMPVSREDMAEALHYIEHEEEMAAKSAE